MNRIKCSTRFIQSKNIVCTIYLNSIFHASMITRTHLFSDNLGERLDAARGLSAAEQTEIRSKLRKASPIKPWPFGMPTSINPYLLILGVSPGARKDDNECSPYKLPTIGEPHEGFGGEFAEPAGDWDNAYWIKLRQLCTALLQSVDPTLTARESLSLSGHLNLGTAQEGKAGEHALNSKVLAWVPDVIVNTLRPRILICFGLKGLLANSKRLRDAFRKNPTLARIVDSKAMEVPFRFKSSSKYTFSIWEVKRPDGGQMSVVFMPKLGPFGRRRRS